MEEALSVPLLRAPGQWGPVGIPLPFLPTLPPQTSMVFLLSMMCGFPSLQGSLVDRKKQSKEFLNNVCEGISL